MTTKKRVIIVFGTLLVLVAVCTGLYIHNQDKSGKIEAELDRLSERSGLDAKPAECEKRSSTLYACKQESSMIDGLSRTIRVRIHEDTSLNDDVRRAVNTFEDDNETD